MCWVSHKATPAPDSEAPDFLSLHKRAASARVTTPKDLRYFRRELDDAQARAMPVTPRGSSLAPPKDLIPSDVIPGFAYGRKVRPSTPIQAVISYRWADQSEQELQQFYTEFREYKEAEQTQVRRIPLTNSSRGHASNAKRQLQQKETKELFKIERFKRVPTKIKNGRRRPCDIDPGCSASCAGSDTTEQIVAGCGLGDDLGDDAFGSAMPQGMAGEL
jgi:hypothetical protein